MQLVKEKLTYDVEAFNTRLEECFGDKPPMEPWTEEQRHYLAWDAVRNDPQLKDHMYTPETATDFAGVLAGFPYGLDFCKEYAEDRTRYLHDEVSFVPPIGDLKQSVSYLTFGVSDNIGQILEHFQRLENATGYDFGQCLLVVHPIFRKDQPQEGGWRWHKWGQYVGKFNPQCEYLSDETGIDMVLCFKLIAVKPRTESVLDSIHRGEPH